MADERFPEHLRRFLADKIRSVSQLEMLLLFRSEPERDWSADEIGRALYIAPDMCADQLEQLHAGGLLAAGNAPRHYRYAPRDAETDKTMAETAAMYQERRVTVITAIYSEPIDKIRTFAEAFRLRKEK